VIDGANGPLRKGTRVQTQWDEGRNCDYKWYVGTVQAVYTNGKCKISYDDPDEWTGDGVWVYALPPHHPGYSQKVAYGAPTMDGIPGMATQGAAQVGMPVMGAVAMPVGAPPPMAAGAVAMGTPMMTPPPAAGGMQVMTLRATVPGGQTMQYQGPSGVMSVQVPMGVMAGQEFQFQVAAQPQQQQGPPVVMAQPMF